MPGVLDGVLAEAPLHTRIVVVRVCTGHDPIRPALALNKEIDLRFVVGYTPLEFRDTLHALAEGTIDASAIVTGRVGLAGVPDAFTALADPETHAKVLIDPSTDADQVTIVDAATRSTPSAAGATRETARPIRRRLPQQEADASPSAVSAVARILRAIDRDRARRGALRARDRRPRVRHRGVLRPVRRPGRSPRPDHSGGGAARSGVSQLGDRLIGLSS